MTPPLCYRSPQQPVVQGGGFHPLYCSLCLLFHPSSGFQIKVCDTTLRKDWTITHRKITLPHTPNYSQTAKQSVFFSKSVRRNVRGFMRANLTRPQGRIFSASLQSRSQFSASLQTFCLTVRANLNTQKYGLFCSLKYSHLDCSQPSFKALTQRRRRPPRERPQSKATTLHVWHVHHLIWCLFCRHYTTTRGNFLRDGPLENLWGGRAKYKKNFRAREN